MASACREPVPTLRVSPHAARGRAGRRRVRAARGPAAPRPHLPSAGGPSGGLAAPRRRTRRRLDVLQSRGRLVLRLGSRRRRHGGGRARLPPGADALPGGRRRRRGRHPLGEGPRAGARRACRRRWAHRRIERRSPADARRALPERARVLDHPRRGCRGRRRASRLRDAALADPRSAGTLPLPPGAEEGSDTAARRALHARAAGILPLDGMMNSGTAEPAAAGRATSAAGVTWDLATLYAGPDDARLEADLAEARRAADDFAGRYRGRAASLTPAELAVAIAEYEAIEERGRRPSFYASLLFAADTQDEAAKRLSERTREVWVEVVNALTFFELEVKDLPDERYAAFVASRALADCRHWMDGLRKLRPHTLSEPE